MSLRLLLSSFFLLYFFIINIFNIRRFFFEWEIFFLNSVRVVFSLIFDWLRISFLILVFFISSMVIIYSFYYIDGDKDYFRFSIILLLFVISMIFLILRPNIVSLLLGWDGLGLTSYALVIFYQRERSCNSGIITVLRNRVGDCCLLLRIGWVLSKGGWNYLYYLRLDNFIIFLLILGSFTKRAQIPFSAWLPAAIAAPTPVSSLVHSSTLVTAGVYLIIRFSFCLEFGNLLFIRFFMGLLTILMRGLVANFETDLKKVIALSTLSQLGLIILVLGMGKPILAFFHLVVHAIFKSTLFIRRGFVIHNNQGSQDSRFLGIFNIRSPVLGVVFSCTNIALCGFPFLAGFFSKDIIMELGFRRFFREFTVFLLVVSVGLTLIYRLRFLFMVTGQVGKIFVVGCSSDFNVLLVIRIFLLFSLSFFGGFILSFFILDFINFYILSLKEKFYVFMVLIFSFLLVLSFTGFFYKKKFIKLVNFLRVIFYLPNLTGLSSFLFLKSSSLSFKILEKGWLEVSGPFFLKDRLLIISTIIQRSQFVRVISFYFIFSLLLFIFVFSIFYLKSSKSIMLKP